MKFGWTYEEEKAWCSERNKLEQIYFKKNYKKEIKCFCFLPQKLRDGRWCWLETVYKHRIDIETNERDYSYLITKQSNECGMSKVRYRSTEYRHIWSLPYLKEENL